MDMIVAHAKASPSPQVNLIETPARDPRLDSTDR
jgi:hypothetical protein